MCVLFEGEAELAMCVTRSFPNGVVAWPWLPCAFYATWPPSSNPGSWVRRGQRTEKNATPTKLPIT